MVGMVLGLFTQTTHAEPVVGVSKPIEISTCTELQNINQRVTGNNNYSYYYFVLVNDIDCSDTVNWNDGKGFIPIGNGDIDGNNARDFQGSFDGRGHTISGLYIDRSQYDSSYVGLFRSTREGYEYTSDYQNVQVPSRLLNFSLTDATVIGKAEYICGIVGYSYNTSFDRVHLSGDILRSECAFYSFVGGIAGYMSSQDGNGSISRSTVEGSITAGSNCPDSAYFLYAGGIAGVTQYISVSDSSAQMDISADGAINNNNLGRKRSLGGLIGQSYQSNVMSSFAGGSLSISGDANSPLSYQVGGLIGSTENGSATIDNSFANSVLTVPATCTSDCGSAPRKVGAIVGLGSDIDFSTSYYDQLASGAMQCNGAGSLDCTAVNTSLDPDANYFINNATNPPLSLWDFSNVWQTTSGLPTLRDIDPYPAVPTDVQATIGSLYSINLSWTAPTMTGSSPVMDYFIRYRKSGDSAWQSIRTTDNATEAVLTGLRSGTQYDITVTARNTTGYSKNASEIIQGTTATPGFHLIRTCQELQNINQNLGDNYELANNIDCSDTYNWNNGDGFLPIGDPLQGQSEYEIGFRGVLKGNNYTISDLFINVTLKVDEEGNYLGGGYGGLFAAAQNALIQDVNLSRPYMHVRNYYNGFLTGYSISTTLTNNHVSGAVMEGASYFFGGLSGYSQITVETRDSKNSFEGVMHYTDEACELVGIFYNDGECQVYGYTGGLYAYRYGYGDDSSIVMHDSYANINVIIDKQPAEVIEGGFVIGGVSAYAGGNDSSTLEISNSYTTGTVTDNSELTAEENGTGRYAGGFLAFTSGTVNLRNSFSHMNFNDLPEAESTIRGGLAGSYEQESSNIEASTSYFDADRAGTTDCDYLALIECTAISGQPSYFYNNSTNPPLDLWDFTNIWKTTSTLPVFNKKVLTTITEVPPSRLNPPTTVVPGKPSGGGITAQSPVAPGVNLPPALARIGAPSGTPSPEAVPEKGIIATLKKILNSIPEAVLVSFPYLLFGLLLAGAGAMFLEMTHQARRLQVLNRLLARQKNIAEERDTFWHLAANYLRAPITLLMGGVDMLFLSKPASDTATRIKKLADTMQSNVADIMHKIEHSKSLQNISHPPHEPAQRVVRQLRFWLPLGAVAVLSILANYVATNFRDIQISNINYATQIMIFVLLAVLLYWVLSALGVVSRKRRRAEAVLAQQRKDLDTARSDLIHETSALLNEDVAKLGILLAKVPKDHVALPTLHEGAYRLKHITDTFDLLINAQTNQLSALSPAGATSKLGSLVDDALEATQSDIHSKKLHVDRSMQLGNLAVPGSQQVVNQVVSSVIANAVAFSPEGGTLSIALQSHADGTNLIVHDQGPGISKDQLDHIFQPFTKADGYTALQMDHDGMGVNLYLNKMVMDHVGGTIDVQSKAGKGTTVTMHWPTTQKVHTPHSSPSVLATAHS